MIMKFKKMTIDCVLNTLAYECGNKEAVVFEDTVVTFHELYESATIIAENFLDIGIKKDSKVAVLLPNCMEYIYIYFALFKIGAWIVPLSTRYEADELRRVISDSDAEVIIYKDTLGIFDYNDILLNKINDSLGKIYKYIVIGDGVEGRTVPFEYFMRKSSKLESDYHYEEIQPDDIAILGYTSGTTGHPKGVMITHGNLVETSYYGGEILEINNEIGFSIAPLYAAQGFNAVLVYFCSGITMKWISNFNPNDILAHVTKNNINLFHTQPTMWSMILSMQYYHHVYFKHLKKVVVSGSLCTPNLAARIEESTKCTLINAYGIIEATGLVSMTRLDDPLDVRMNTVGRPITGFQIKIVDENRKEVPKGEIGELAIKGCLMKGYYRQPEKTKEVIDDEGWLYTGDLAKYYKDNINICIVGRKKDMIIRGGFNVYPVDIEECLLGFDKVDDVSVVAKEDTILGEAIVAFVIPKAGVELKEGEIKAFCRGKISNYRIPDIVHFVSQFPVLDSGKIQKNILREWAENGIPADSQFLLNDTKINGIAKL